MKRQKRGSLTAEATIVLPVVIFIIMVVIRMCIVHYQNVVVSAEAMRVASRSAAYWQELKSGEPPAFRSSESAAGWITDNTFRDHDPYQNVADFFNDGAKEANATTIAGEILRMTPNLLGDDTALFEGSRGVSVNRDIVGLHGYVRVTVTRQNENPLGYLYEKLGLTTPDEFTVTAKAVQTDSTEFMRNFSLLCDLVTGEFSGSAGGGDNVSDE